MNGDIYEILALAMRYVFAAIMALIAIRAWKITIVDSQRAAQLRRLSPETGLCGEFLVVEGNGRAREGMRYPVIREGLIGASRKADVRVRSRYVRRSHAFFELTDQGLRVRANNRAPMYFNGRARREVTILDGDHLTVGRVELMLILNAPVPNPVRRAPDEAAHGAAGDADLFSPGDSAGFESPADVRTEPSSGPGDSWARPEAGDDDIKIYTPARATGTADAEKDDVKIYTPTRVGGPQARGEEKGDPPKAEAVKAKDESGLRAQQDRTNPRAPAIPGWDDEWDERPRAMRAQKRRAAEDDDLFHDGFYE